MGSLRLEGRTVLDADFGEQAIGVLQKQLDVGNLASGIYFVVGSVSDGTGSHLIGTFKLAVVH